MSSYISPERISSIHAQARASGIAVPGNRGIKIVQSCTIGRNAAELYRFWRKPENIPRVIKYPIEILPLAQNSHWWLSAWVNGHRAEWNTVIINDEPDELIAWQSLEGAPVPHAGTIRFEPASDGSGTEVTVQVEYDQPGGKMAALFARLTGGDPAAQVREALRRCKALLETGAMPDEAGPARG